MVNAFYDSYQILNKVYSEGSFLKQAITNTIIEEKNRSYVVKICYGVLEKDIELSYYINYLCEKSPKCVVKTLLKIAIYNIKYLEKKPYAVIDNIVALTKKLGKSGVSGFINAVLRKYITLDIPLPTEEINRLSIKYSYPIFAIKMLINDYGKERTEKIISSSDENTTLVFFDYDGEKYLNDIKVSYQKTPFENVFFAKNFVMNSDFTKGIYTFQSIGSVAICDVVEKGEKLIDVCSAPGGKSVNLSRKFKSVLSLELYPHRTELINSYKDRMNRKNIIAKCEDATIYNKDYEQQFDSVLADVPCSGFGVAKENPDMFLNKDENNIAELKVIQGKILNNVKNYVKIGGYLYFSTCSLFKTENINNVKRFLKANDNFEICELNSKIPAYKENGTLQFLPDISYGCGFFVAKLKRIK